MIELVTNFAIRNWLTGAAIAGAIIFGWKLLDYVLVSVLKSLEPEEFLLKFIDDLEEKIMKDLKKKTPETAKIIHARLINFVSRLEDKLKEDNPN